LDKKWLPLFLIILIMVFLMGGCQVETENPPEKEPGPPENVAAYISTWSNWKAESIKGEYLSDLIIAFAGINQKDGYSLEMSGASTVMAKAAAIKAKYPHLKISVSVGGYGAEGFSDMADDPNLRAAFTTDVCAWLTKYNLDGVDIDWEYPVGPSWGQSIKSRPQDKQNYISLLRDTRNALDALGGENGKRYSLSTAVPASSWFTTANDVKAAAEITDGLKLMAYDYSGEWSGATGHNANLFRSSRGNSWSSDDAVKAYLNAQVPAKKIILGVAFYGQAWRGVTEGSYPSTPGFARPGKFWKSPDWTAIQTYLKPDSGYTRYWDNSAKAPFLYNGDRWISYTDHEQIRELCGYAKGKNLGGVFVWEYSHDMSAELLKTLAENYGQVTGNR